MTTRAARPFSAVIYQDTGCPDGVHSSCLKCPLPRCRFEEPPVDAVSLRGIAGNEAKQARAQNRYGQIAEAVYSEGLTYQQAQERFGVSKKTVDRALAAERERARMKQ